MSEAAAPFIGQEGNGGAAGHPKSSRRPDNLTVKEPLVPPIMTTRCTGPSESMATRRAWIAPISATGMQRPRFERMAQLIYIVLLLTIGGLDVFADLESAQPHAPPASAVVFWELTSIVSAIGLLIFLWPLLRRLHRYAGPAARKWAMLGGLGLMASLVHIATFKLLRLIGAATLGPAFACPIYGKLPYEFAKDSIVFAALIGGLFLVPKELRSAIFDVLPAPKPRLPMLVQSSGDLVDIADGRTRLRLKCGDIAAVNAAGNYAEFHLMDDRRPLVRTTLALLEMQLNPKGFLRVHRSWIVNPAHVRRMVGLPSGDFELTLANGETIPASRRFSEAMAGVASAGRSLGVLGSDVA